MIDLRKTATTYVSWQTSNIFRLLNSLKLPSIWNWKRGRNSGPFFDKRFQLLNFPWKAKNGYFPCFLDSALWERTRIQLAKTKRNYSTLS